MKKSTNLLPLGGLPWDSKLIAKQGFDFDCSGDAEFVTDRCLLFQAKSAARGDWKLRREIHASRMIAPEAIRKLWDEAEDREVETAVVLGTFEYFGLGRSSERPIRQLAVLRDSRKRLLVVDAYRLAFALHTLRFTSIGFPEKMAPSAEKNWVSFYREGLVGVLAPSRYTPADLDILNKYDLSGKPISLEPLRTVLGEGK